ARGADCERTSTSTADVAHLHAPRALRSLGSDLGIAILTPLPDAGHELRELSVVGARAQSRAKIGAAGREQTRVEHAVRAQPRARTFAAKWLRHAGDDADLAAAVGVAPAFGDFTRVARVDRFERQLRRDALDDLLAAHHVVEPPAVGDADVHELDEAHDLPAALEVARELHERAVARTAPHHRVDL